MKMEVVLSSPGRFEDDGTPFRNEEIREWSGVDRITGMLERARIETGRWSAFDENAAHSYGKVVDSRERNSADGSIIQKARRQVEVFQSQEPGRSVQVVRASQWSSSRVTDSIELPFASQMSSWHLPSLPQSPAEKIPINSQKNFSPKRSNSDEDISLSSESTSSSLFSRKCKSRRSLQIPTTNLEDQKIKIECSKIGQETKKDHVKSDKEIYMEISSAISGSRGSSITIKAPSLKTPRPQVTVVNLINPESFEGNKKIGKKSSIVTLRPTERSPELQRHSLVKTYSSDDGVSIPGRAVKKVGFCKTEIHFAADSGKVNIVETDGKPPPTNKFRRRRRNNNLTVSPQTSASLKSIETDSSGAYCIVDLNSKKFWNNSDDKNEGNHRIHTTTINLGDLNSDSRRDIEEIKVIEDLASPRAVSEVISRVRNSEKSQNEGNIVTKDSENNRVLSTVVTTHETTIARVEDNSRVPKRSLVEKKSESNHLDSIDINKMTENKKKGDIQKNQARKSPVYANVFNNIGDRFPVYENYRVESGKLKGTGEKNLKNDNMSEKKKIDSEVKKNGSEGSRGSSEKKKGIKNPIKTGKKSLVTSTTKSTSSIGSKSPRDLAKIKTSKRHSIISTSGEIGSKPGTIKKPLEVVYKTAVYNMKNEKFTKPNKGKEIKTGPRLINDLICGGKSKRPTVTSSRKTITSQSSKNAAQPLRHWK